MLLLLQTPPFSHIPGEHVTGGIWQKSPMKIVEEQSQRPPVTGHTPPWRQLDASQPESRSGSGDGSSAVEAPLGSLGIGGSIPKPVGTKPSSGAGSDSSELSESEPEDIKCESIWVILKLWTNISYVSNNKTIIMKLYPKRASFYTYWLLDRKKVIFYLYLLNIIILVVIVIYMIYM